MAGLWGSNFENLVLNAANFSSSVGSNFSRSLGNNNTALVLNFTPVPEPSPYALLGLGLRAVGFTVDRRRRT